MGKYSKEI